MLCTVDCSGWTSEKTLVVVGCSVTVTREGWLVVGEVVVDDVLDVLGDDEVVVVRV